MKPKSQPAAEKTLDKHIVLSVQQLFTYGVFLVTIGASIYTFFKAIPKIDKLDETVNQLKVSNTRVEERITALREVMAARKEGAETKK
jgi:hypothetical protein